MVALNLSNTKKCKSFFSKPFFKIRKLNLLKKILDATHCFALKKSFLIVDNRKEKSYHTMLSSKPHLILIYFVINCVKFFSYLNFISYTFNSLIK